MGRIGAYSQHAGLFITIFELNYGRIRYPFLFIGLLQPVVGAAWQWLGIGEAVMGGNRGIAGAWHPAHFEPAFAVRTSLDGEMIIVYFAGGLPLKLKLLLITFSRKGYQFYRKHHATVCGYPHGYGIRGYAAGIAKKLFKNVKA